jgi:hypothetical protein
LRFEKAVRARGVAFGAVLSYSDATPVLSIGTKWRSRKLGLGQTSFIDTQRAVATTVAWKVRQIGGAVAVTTAWDRLTLNQRPRISVELTLKR